MFRSNICILLFLLVILSCTKKIDKKNFTSVLNSPCMVVNQEQDNTIEGTYFVVENCTDSTIQFTFPKNFVLSNANCSNWYVGWGSNKPFYDAGVENCRKIIFFDSINNQIKLGSIVRGNGFPTKGQRIVFWNSNPSGYVNYIRKPIINPSIWLEFSGKSVFFGSVEYDSLLGKWIMLANENDTSKIQIYAAMSDNLIDWTATNNAKPIFTAKDFSKCSWAGFDKTGKINQTPFVTDIIRFKKKWYVFLTGFDHFGKRNIGLAISDKSLIGPYRIIDKPILTPGENGTWNDNAVSFAKVREYKGGFILFYDGQNSKGSENVGMAHSSDLIHWTNAPNNPVISQHTGWRSSELCSEPVNVEVRNDSILLMIAGMKKFKMGFWHHYITQRMYLDVSGNVDDTQWGIYLSTDGGNTFVAHSQNPIFTNDYSNIYENEHMGINFKRIETDTADLILYQAKSSFEGLHYNIMLRSKTKRDNR